MGLVEGVRTEDSVYPNTARTKSLWKGIAMKAGRKHALGMREGMRSMAEGAMMLLQVLLAVHVQGAGGAGDAQTCQAEVIPPAHVRAAH